MTAAAPLAGRAAIVTGAAKNIGRAIALALAEDGASVLVAARSARADLEETAEAVEQRGGRAAIFLGDLSEPAAAGDLVDTCIDRFGRLDCLVNNAALRSDAAVTDITAEDWRRILASILDATFFATQAAIPHLRSSDLASVVTFGGVVAHVGIAHRAHVAAAKAGVVGLTRALAAELAGDGITVNCVSPGPIETERRGPVPEHFRQRPVPLGRHGQPEEVAAMVRYLAGPAARFVTGQTLHVNGGWHMGT